MGGQNTFHRQCFWVPDLSGASLRSHCPRAPPHILESDSKYPSFLLTWTFLDPLPGKTPSMPPNRIGPSSQRSSLEAEHCPPLAYLIPGSSLFLGTDHPTTLGLLMVVPVSRLWGFVLAVSKRSRVAPRFPVLLVWLVFPPLPSGGGLQTFSSRSPRPPTPPSLRAVICTPFLRDAGGDAVCAGDSSTCRADRPSRPAPRPIGCAEGTYRALANEVRGGCG